MMKVGHTLLASLLAIGFVACSATPEPKNTGAILPLKTVRLYETGVGYFERTGAASPTSGTALPVPAAHLDDALKTLVVVSERGEATVDGLEFDSSVTEGMARALAGLPKGAQTKLTYMRVLSSLEGEQVTVRTKGDSLVGRVIDVIEPPPPEVALPDDDEPDGKGDSKGKAPAKRPELMLLLLTQDNEIRQLPSTEIESVQPTSPVSRSRLDLALNALSTRAPQGRRMVKVIANAKGPVTLGYIAETPLWRTTYRVVLDPQEPRGKLQGWALLHNDTDEDWRQVRVQLVNGRPDSFLFPLAAPRYGRRELVTPEAQLSTIPQLLDQTPDAIWGDHAGLGHGTGYGYGSGHGRLGRSHRARAPRVRMGSTVVRPGGGASDLLSIGNLAGVRSAAGVESAALFIYTLPRPLDLRAHGSALVPFVQAAVHTERITWVGGDDDEPRMGVLFSNNTKQTLPPGPITFFSDGGFAGESALDRMKPNERRYLQYGMDIDVEVSRVVDKSREQTRRLEYRGDQLYQHYVRTDLVTYTIENRSGQARSVHWALSVVRNAKVEGADEVRFDDASDTAIAIFRVPAKKKAEREVKVEQGLFRANAADMLSVAFLEELAEMDSLPAEHRKVAEEAAKRQARMDEANRELHEVAAEMERVQKDIERLRKHLEALGGEKGGAGANPFVKRILDAEDELEALRTKHRKLEEERGDRLEAVRDAFAPLVQE
ncbi:MAG: DUF4139 domain-containing protein [Myxococcota bacterium]